ncbi:MAG: methyltransferase domain-containing protein, partial [Bdellovibrionales bacterium]|nr:methyltransferase domain-containing protein [Bdellovibrionales bacterium]
LVLTDLTLEDEEWYGAGIYGSDLLIPFNELKLDAWDRVCGRTAKGIPFVLSRAAQVALFDSADELTDDSISLGGKTVLFEPWTWEVKAPSTTEFWNNFYRAKDAALPWELPGPHPALEAMLKQMKPPRSRISVFGCGGGHDAAYLANQSHIVKAYDFSADAIALAKSRYPRVDGLEFVQQDVLELPKRLYGMSDIIIEHTLFCAISPTRRKDLVHMWNRALVPSGYVVGIFFVMDRTQGPPFGTTEFEIHELLKKEFRFVYWNRWKSVPGTEGVDGLPTKRDGIELVVVAQKK